MLIAYFSLGIAFDYQTVIIIIIVYNYYDYNYYWHTGMGWLREYVNMRMCEYVSGCMCE